MKKLASLILALAMCLALGAPAFATSTTGDMSTELSQILPELKMTLPTTTTIILNPYRNAVADSVATANAGIDKGDRLQIMNGVFTIASTTQNKVHVSAKVTGAVSGNAQFAAADVAPGAAGHDVYLTLSYVSQKDAANANAAVTVPVPDNVDPKKVTNVTVISDSEQTLEWNMDAAKASGAGSVQRINMQFGGSCSDSPTEDEGPWTDSDTVSASFVFEVTPVTDFPMIQMVYQATDNTPTHKDLVIPTTKPADYKDTPVITGIKSAVVTSGAYTLGTVAAGDNTWNGSAWDGTKITLKKESFGTVLGVAAQTVVLEVSMTYKDAAGAVHDVVYTAKVNVLAAPAPSA